MVMQNNVYREEYIGRLPDWFRVDAVVSQVSDEVGLRCGIYAKDGDVQLLSLHNVTAVYSPARPLRVALTKREILEAVLESAAKQLAELELERT